MRGVVFIVVAATADARDPASPVGGWRHAHDKNEDDVIKVPENWLDFFVVL